MPFTRLVKRYEPRLRATPRKRVVYEPRALCSVDMVVEKVNAVCYVCMVARLSEARSRASTAGSAFLGMDGADGDVILPDNYR